MTNRTKQIWTNILAYLLIIIAIILDSFLKLHVEELVSFTTILFPCVVTIAGFLITFYIMFLENYKDRYSFDTIQKKQSPENAKLFQAILFDIIVGSVVLCIGKGFISFVLFCFFSIITIVTILIHIFRANKSLMLNSYIEDFCGEVEKQLKESKTAISSDLIENIKNVLDECATKEEYHTIAVIVEKTGHIFRAFLKNSIAILDENAEGKEKVSNMFDSIMALNMFELELCKTIKSAELIKKIIRQQRKNMCFCIDASRNEWYDCYLEEYLRYLLDLKKDSYNDVVDFVYGSFVQLVIHLYKNDKNEIAKTTLKKIAEYNFVSVKLNKSISIKDYIIFLAGAIDYAVKNKNEDLLDFVVEQKQDLSFIFSKHKELFGEAAEYYKIIFSAVCEYDYIRALSLYENISKVFSYDYTQNPTALEYNMYCLNLLSEEDDSGKKQGDKLFDFHIELLCQVIKAKEKYTGFLFFPDFYSIIEPKLSDTEGLKRIASQIRKVLNNCILSDNLYMFYSFIQSINSVLEKLGKEKRQVQEILLDLYLWTINRTSQLTNKQFVEIVFYNLNDIVRKMDGKRLISEHLGKFIINGIRNCCRQSVFKCEAVTEKGIEFLFELMLEGEECSFVATKYETKRFLYKTLFNIGTDCIENGREEGVRSTSNALGWLIIYAIKERNDNLIKYLIERVIELYRIAKDMQISHQTQMFMLTLFPTVGAFCCKENANKKYCDMLIDGIQDEKTINVKTAVRLRTSENDMWNTLYEGRTDELTKKFLEKYDEKCPQCKEIRVAV